MSRIRPSARVAKPASRAEVMPARRRRRSSPAARLRTPAQQPPGQALHPVVDAGRPVAQLVAHVVHEPVRLVVQRAAHLFAARDVADDALQLLAGQQQVGRGLCGAAGQRALDHAVDRGLVEHVGDEPVEAVVGEHHVGDADDGAALGGDGEHALQRHPVERLGGDALQQPGLHRHPHHVVDERRAQRVRGDGDQVGLDAGAAALGLAGERPRGRAQGERQPTPTMLRPTLATSPAAPAIAESDPAGGDECPLPQHPS